MFLFSKICRPTLGAYTASYSMGTAIFLLRQQHLYPSDDGCLFFPYPKRYSDNRQHALFNPPYLNANELRPMFTQDDLLYRRALEVSKVMESERPAWKEWKTNPKTINTDVETGFQKIHNSIST